MKSGTLSAVACALSAALIGGAAGAQPSPILIQPAIYGEVITLYGETLALTDPSAPCTADEAGLVQDCDGSLLESLQAAGLTQVTLMKPEGKPMAGYHVTGDVFDVRLEPGSEPEIRVRRDNRAGLLVPRNCFTLPNEPRKYSVDTEGTFTVAREYQTVICDGGMSARGIPGHSGRSLPATMPRLGETPYYGGQPAWPAESLPEVSGDSYFLAAADAACPKEHQLKDGLCFSRAVAFMDANPNVKEVLVLGHKRYAGGASANDMDQFRLKRKKKGYDVDKRMFDRELSELPPDCGTLSSGFRIAANADGDRMVTPWTIGICSPPLAPIATSIYELYSDENLTVTPYQGCPQEFRLLSGYSCFSQVAGYMQQNGIRKIQVIVLDNNYAPGSRLDFRGREVDFAHVFAAPDFSGFSGDRLTMFQKNMQAPGQCEELRDAPAGSEGVLIESSQTARFFGWYACPD